MLAQYPEIVIFAFGVALLLIVTIGVWLLETWAVRAARRTAPPTLVRSSLSIGADGAAERAALMAAHADVIERLALSYRPQAYQPRASDQGTPPTSGTAVSKLALVDYERTVRRG